MGKTILCCFIYLASVQNIQAETKYFITSFGSLTAFLVPAIYPAKTVLSPEKKLNSTDDKKPVKTEATVKTKKIGFFSRMAFKLTPKKFRNRFSPDENELVAANKKAKTSLILGIVALGLALIPWYTILVAIPVGITAIVLGSKAKKMGAKNMTGVGFGIGALAVVVAWFLAAVIFIAAFYVW